MVSRSHHISPGMLNPDVTLPISAFEISFACPSAWFAAVTTMSSSNCASAGLTACGSILMDAIVPSHLATTFTAPPPLVASTVRAASCAWIVSICCCMRAACFMSLPMLDIIQLFLLWFVCAHCLGADFNNLPFENLQRLLNQRIILEIVLVELRRRGFFPGLAGGGGRRFCFCRCRCGRFRFRRGFHRLSGPVCRPLCLDEFNLRARVAQFAQLRLQQRVVARIVHQTDVVFEFWIKSDRKYIFRKRNRVRFQQIGSRERACPAHC